VAKKKKVITTAEPVAATATAPVAPPPSAMPTEAEMTLSWRWHITTLAIVSLVIVAIFFSYKWGIRRWAGNRLAVASAFLDYSAQLKSDYLNQPDGYTPTATFVEQEMAATVSFQSVLVSLQEAASLNGTTTISQADLDLIRTRRTNLTRLADEILATPPPQMPPVLAKNMLATRDKIHDLTAQLETLEGNSFSTVKDLTSALWKCHMTCNDLVLQRFPQLRGMFDYMAALEMAIFESRRAIGADNSYVDAFDVLARSLEEQGLLEDAADQYVAVVELAPQSARAGEIVAAYEKQTSDVPADLNAHYTLGRLYRARGQRDQALASLKKVIDLDGGKPDEPQTYTGYLARKVCREVVEGTRDEFAPGREG